MLSSYQHETTYLWLGIFCMVGFTGTIRQLYYLNYIYWESEESTDFIFENAKLFWYEYHFIMNLYYAWKRDLILINFQLTQITEKWSCLLLQQTTPLFLIITKQNFVYSRSNQSILLSHETKLPVLSWHYPQ